MSGLIGGSDPLDPPLGDKPFDTAKGAPPKLVHAYCENDEKKA